ncbi:hypothetical protein IGI04_042243 [Brassica rapa subsp. trilocularis]|uniref:Uncharacterized protein n=1 Tax=Brassica rapa subsp. trilocularis TaxID=1813537 RepID=A0ABQ7KIU4_BRACM|nr:hypothetical protein IGI04_042243 [Brassica rapa subsp. trilocularis]
MPIQEGAQTKTEHSWLCEEEGYSIKAASIVRRVIAIREEEEVRIQVVHKEWDTCNSPTTKNVKTKVLCHCISSLGHSLVYRKCSMGHYAMRGVSCETLYGDSNTLVPVSVLSLRGSLNAYDDPWQEAVQSSLGEYHCLSLTKDVPGQFLASLRWLRSLLRGGDPNHFSKMAVKSVERGRLQTGSMKR